MVYWTSHTGEVGKVLRWRPGATTEVGGSQRVVVSHTVSIARQGSRVTATGPRALSFYPTSGLDFRGK